MQVKKYVVLCTYVLHMGQSGDGVCEAVTLSKHDRRNGDLFVLS